MRKRIFIPVFLILFLFAGLLLAFDFEQIAQLKNKGGTDRVLINYGNIIDSLGQDFDLPEDFLFALIMLESSGKKNVAVRFEKEVYRKLLLTQKGEISGFEYVNRHNLKDLSKSDLKKLACSYGPFQIMGYKIFELNISLNELSGKNNIYWALLWINNNYGNYLRSGAYKDAFHLHNVGKKYPKNGKPETFDPDYVQKGIKYAKYFQEILRNEHQ